MQVILQDICKCLNVKYHQLKIFVTTIWLSVYDVTLSTIYIFNVVQYFISHL